MKKISSFILLALLVVGVVIGCKKKDDNKIVVGATIVPHAEILREAIPILKEKGIELEVKEFESYSLINKATADKELDANFFQHEPYLIGDNKEQNIDLVSIGNIHCEPLGGYLGKIDSLDDLKDGSKVAVPNDPTNEARALLLLESNGLITLEESAGLNATTLDIKENPKNLNIVEMEAAQIGRSLKDVDLAIMNGNFALLAELSVEKDAVLTEDKDIAETYGNIIAVRSEDKDKPALVELTKALKSDEIKKFIEDKYNGAVVAVD